jgi:hypothetical protein
MDARREEDALDLRRLRSRLGAVIGEAVDVAVETDAASSRR